MTTLPLIPLTELTDDGDTILLPNGRQLRLRIERDPHTTFEDYDCYGAVGYGETDRNTGRPRRPSGFDGNAEKMSVDRGEPVWWQPPRGDYEVKRTDPAFPAFREQVRRLAESGWSVVVLEVLDGTDAYGRPIVVDVASLGAVDDVSPAYLPDLLGEMVDELDLGVMA